MLTINSEMVRGMIPDHLPVGIYGFKISPDNEEICNFPLSRIR